MAQRDKLLPLTSLRFFAAAMIVLGHSHAAFGSFGLALNLSLAQGVSFFFVLSGFILAYNYPNVEERLVSFYRARVARLWPTHIAAILALPLIAGTWNSAGMSAMDIVYVLLGNALLVQAWVPFRESFLTFNGVAWSISTEAFFYLAFPFAMISLRRSWIFPLVVAAGLTAFFMWLAVRYHISSDVGRASFSVMGVLYTNPLARLTEFVLGMVAWRCFEASRARIDGIRGFLWRSPGFWTVVEVATVAACIYSLHKTPRLPVASLVPPGWVEVVQYVLINSGSAPIFALAIVVFAYGKGAMSAALRWSPIVFLGESSFALYLFHATTLLWFEQRPAIVALPYSGALYWISTLILAGLVHVLIEKPCRDLILGRRPWRLARNAPA
ncbi:acyltransferase family protein [Bordetella genomosp. 8]|nr:acyltransferase [Bordetella genomosp. 8]